VTTDILLIDTTDRIRTITLNRPESRNALSAALRSRFFGALCDAEADSAVDVVIVTGQIRFFALDWTSRNSATQRRCLICHRCPISHRSGRR
jgi:enoyl-CoA hydratase/carnithine racemase